VKVAVVKDAETEETLDGLASKYFQDVDLILTEGYKKEYKPKIEIFRSQVHETPLFEGDKSLVALVSDTNLDLGVPCFDLDDTEGLADFVEKRFLSNR
jgi:molybdopterin-guanine dinucleotide biosynthesis protein MobB